MYTYFGDKINRKNLHPQKKKLYGNSWKEVFQSWIKLTFIENQTSNNMVCKRIWNNPKITINNRSLILKTFLCS